MRSTLVMRQESLATGVSATGTEVEGGESTWGYFGLFSLSILGGGEFQSGRRECRKEVRDEELGRRTLVKGDLRSVGDRLGRRSAVKSDSRTFERATHGKQIADSER